MPITKDRDGWWWGGKGPFDTKSKALAVARAAHASGFKGEKEMATNNEMPSFALVMLHAVTNGHILHLAADSTAVHLAMGEFYTSLEGLADELIESYQGKYEKITDYGSFYMAPPKSPIEFMISLLEYVENNRDDLPQDTYLQNIVDEIVQTITSTLNKLRFYK